MAGPGAYSFDDDERAEVLDVLQGGHLSRYGDLGDSNFKRKVYTLEQEFLAHCGAQHAVATNSGTSALLLALLALGIGEGDEVLVPGFTYIATFSSIIHVRAVPVLVEIDETLTISPDDLAKKITSRTKAIVAVHMLGSPCNMAAITTLASHFDLALIEDACQAAGASFKGKRVGSFGAAGAFSFNRYKIISAGEGGLLTVANSSLYERAFALHDQGHRPLRIGKHQIEPGVIGLNLKMNELTAAVALAQLRKVDRMLEVLRGKKRVLDELIPDIDGLVMRPVNDIDGECATFMTIIFDDPTRAATTAKALGIAPLSETGWHNYRLMEHITEHRTPRADWSPPSRYAEPGALPRTDSILSRSVNISVGVVDSGLGSGFGININSEINEIEAVATRLIDAVHAR